MAWFRRVIAARRVSTVVASFAFWGLWSDVRPVLARGTDFRGVESLEVAAKQQFRETKLIVPADGEGLASCPLTAQPPPVRSISGVAGGVLRSPFESSLIYGCRSTEGPAALYRPRLPIGLARNYEAGDEIAGSRPFYRKTWFLAGAAGIVVATAILLASGGDGDGRSPIEGGTLPGFPPPPKPLRSDCVPVGANRPSR